MTDTLVVYYSRSGTTERLAAQLASKLGADLEVVRTERSYAGIAGYFKGIWHSLSRRVPELSRGRDVTDYAVVIVGSPIWAGHLSAPMRSYLARYGRQIRPVAAFWVSGGGAGYKNVAAEIEAITGRPLLATAHFSQREVGTLATDAKLDAFVQALRPQEHKAA